MKTLEAARGSWKPILSHFGLGDEFLIDKHGPCPICGGVNRFRFDDKDGKGTYFCNQHGAGDGITLLMQFRQWDFPQAATEVDKILGNLHPAAIKAQEISEEAKVGAIQRLLKASTKLRPDTPAWKYLNNRCGPLPENLPDLRALGQCQHSEGTWFPAMLAVLRYADGTGASVHRTYLTPEGRKAPVDPVRKIMPGKPLAGSCVRLGPVARHLGIAEGIETALCAGRIFRLPVWAAISANGMETWQPPEGVETVSIYGDNDPSFTGQQAAYNLARRMVRLGIRIDEVRIPTDIGTDWADVLSGVA